MKVFYRISDHGYDKQKLPGSSHQVCLSNFIEVFGTEDILLIADNCDKEETTQLLKNNNVTTIFTNNGNAGSLIYSIKQAIDTCGSNENEIVYFVEDDYLHLPQAKDMLLEGIKHADYVTLYDHPDKYTNEYNYGENSKVIRTNSSHWRYTVSTCMTFATTAKILKEDIKIWEEFTAEKHPWDHEIFSGLAAKTRKLAVSIPGAACHIDLTYSGKAGVVLIEPWAVQMMIELLENKVNEINDQEFKDLKEKVLVDNPQGWQRLVSLDSLLYAIK